MAKVQFIDLQGHTNTVPGPHKPLLGRCAVIYLRQLAIDSGVCWWDELVVSVLKHTDGEAFREIFDVVWS